MLDKEDRGQPPRTSGSPSSPTSKARGLTPSVTTVRFTINNEPITVDTDPFASLAGTLRDRLGATRSIPLDQVEHLDLAHAERLDLIDDDAERMHWLTLWLVLEGGERILVYAIGQLEPREPWLQRLFALETDLLARVGLFRDIEHPARKAMERIQPRLD